MASTSEKRLEHINIHLLKSHIKDFKKALSKEKVPTRLKAKEGVLPGGVLYYLVPPSKPVSWRAFLALGFPSTLPSFEAKHASAVLCFPAGSRNFAVTFGYGRALLDESALESDFGLRTAINLCDPETLRAVNYRTIEERTRIGRVQLSEAGSVNAFRMNTDTDLLRGLEAESNDKSVCERLGARWSNLIVAAREEIGDLPFLAKKLLAFYNKKSLPKEYRWIANVRRETDPTIVGALDRELEDRLDQGNHIGIRLALPELAGSTTQTDAKLFGTDGPDFDSAIQTYLDGRPRKVKSTIAAMRHHHVVLVNSSTGSEEQAIPIRRCVVAELEYGSDLYLLADGEWFQLNREFVRTVDKVVSGIPILPHKLPAWKPGEAEAIWNERACKHWSDAGLLDRIGTISYGGGHSRVEPADILTKGRVFGHAKRVDKNSAGLSHLFAQGLVAGELIRRDPKFRKLLAARIPKSHKRLAAAINGTIDPRQWTIGYILLGADGAKPTNSLPFFSKVNLKGAVERLGLMDYRVGLIGV